MPICIYIYICGERPHLVFSKSRINPLNKKKILASRRSVRCISWQSKRKMPMSWPSDALGTYGKHHGVTVVSHHISLQKNGGTIGPWHHGIMAPFSCWSWLSWLTKKRGIHWSHHLSENLDQMGIAQELGTPSAHTKIYNWSPIDLHPPKKWG